jgi:hypothetical protein
MAKKKTKKHGGKATLASVREEMAKPRVAKSARTKYANLDLPVTLTAARKPPSREAAGSPLEGKTLKE